MTLVGLVGREIDLFEEPGEGVALASVTCRHSIYTREYTYGQEKKGQDKRQVRIYRGRRAKSRVFPFTGASALLDRI